MSTGIQMPQQERIMRVRRGRRLLLRWLRKDMKQNWVGQNVRQNKSIVLAERGEGNSDISMSGYGFESASTSAPIMLEFLEHPRHYENMSPATPNNTDTTDVTDFTQEVDAFYSKNCLEESWNACDFQKVQRAIQYKLLSMEQSGMPEIHRIIEKQQLQSFHSIEMRKWNRRINGRVSGRFEKKKIVQSAIIRFWKIWWRWYPPILHQQYSYIFVPENDRLPIYIKTNDLLSCHLNVGWTKCECDLLKTFLLIRRRDVSNILWTQKKGINLFCVLPTLIRCSFVVC